MATANVMQLKIHEDTAVTGGTVVYANNHFRGNNKRPADMVFKKGVTAALTGKNLITPVAGGNFANQPNNDGVEILSNNAADVGIKVTLYGVKHGALTTLITEALTLNGTTVVSSAITDWSLILGVELGSVAAGTVTIREASADQVITTITTTNLSAGVATITESRCRDRKIRIVASGASTKSIGTIGLDPFGKAISVAGALTGATEKDLSADVFRTVTKILIGDVASATTVTIKREEVELYTLVVGAGGTGATRTGGVSPGASEEYVLEPDTDYIISVTNIGETNASTGYLNFFLYEEILSGRA